MKVVVLHEGYGCDTGCCGHVVRLDNGQMIGGYDFDHPYGRDFKEFAMRIAREAVEAEYGEGHTFDLDWGNCEILDD